MQRFIVTGVLVLWPSLVAGQGDGARNAAATITADDVRQRIGVLAHDSMRGRDTPSPEIEIAARYVGREFQAFGLTPGGDTGSFIQRYPLLRTELDIAGSGLAVAGGLTWRFGVDVARRGGVTGPAGETRPVVVVSGRPQSPEQAGALDVEGRTVVLVVPMTPQGGFAPEAQLLFQAVAPQNPAAIVLVTRMPDQQWQTVLGRQGGGRLARGWGIEASPPVVDVRDGTIGPVLAQRGFDLAAAREAGGPATATPLPSLGLTITLTERTLEEPSAPNSVGILEGSDPVLKNEYIVFSAHMDHVGVGRPVNGDSIYNGADDDASGTAAIIELAEAYAQLNPRPGRSMIFLTVSGEEKGLWGSDYFGANPAVPIEQIFANINIDMIGRNWDDTVVVIGKEHSDLGATLNRVNARHAELNMTAIDDIWPEENFYFRSDHYNFAKRGVPILFFFTGVHEDYHRPGDHVEKIKAEKHAQITRLIFYLGLEVANAADKPQWNPESYRAIVEGAR